MVPLTWRIVTEMRMAIIFADNQQSKLRGTQNQNFRCIHRPLINIQISGIFIFLGKVFESPSKRNPAEVFFYLCAFPSYCNYIWLFMLLDFHAEKSYTVLETLKIRV